jgi:hypothetical protein
MFLLFGNELGQLKFYLTPPKNNMRRENYIREEMRNNNFFFLRLRGVGEKPALRVYIESSMT